MKHHTIVNMVDAISRPSKVMQMSITDVQNHIDAIRMEAEHFGMRPEKYTAMPIGELMAEINRRRGQQVTKTPPPEKI